MTTRFFVIFTCFAQFFTSSAFTQRQASDFQNFNPHFEVFPLPGGALGNSVQGIVQDSTGFLWFGTERGLICFDGQVFRNFRDEQTNPNSLSSDPVDDIFLDSKGVLWIAHWTLGGLTDFDPAAGMVEIIPQDLGRVFLNLINNAFYAVQQRKREISENLKFSEIYYEPTVTVSTQKTDNQILIKVKDNGTGIPDDVKARIFQPFFTTKPTGQGTGLGLSLAYDIVTKGHGGTLEVESAEGEGTEFVVQLPVKNNGG